MRSPLRTFGISTRECEPSRLVQNQSSRLWSVEERVMGDEKEYGKERRKLGNEKGDTFSSLP